MDDGRTHETVVLVGGPRDGEHVTVDLRQATLTFPGQAMKVDGKHANLVAQLTPRATYVRVQMQFKDGAVTFYRFSRITDRQALACLAARYRSAGESTRLNA